MEEMEVFWTDPTDPTHQHGRIAWLGGTVCQEGQTGRAYHKRIEAQGRRNSRPGSVYYAGEPPDQDDYWRWCNICQMWHRHDPCF